MGSHQFRLLVSRRFYGLFIAQFFGALNDNLFKNALVIVVAYQSGGTSQDIEVLVTIATALFISPYFIFSATAGQLADKFEKAHLIRWLKLWEIAVMSLATVGFALGSLNFGLAVLCLLGVQAAFFGPVKYGILPELLPPEDLVSGNAVIEAGTFLAILIGTIAGGLGREPHDPARRPRRARPPHQSQHHHRDLEGLALCERESHRLLDHHRQ